MTILTNPKSLQKKNCICIFTRGNRRDPALMLVSPEPTMIIRWCPTLFNLRAAAAQAKSFIALPYRMIFAVATTDSVIVYETQTFTPCAKITDLHYANMTDLAWSHDGRVLFVSSRDGYVPFSDCNCRKSKAAKFFGAQQYSLEAYLRPQIVFDMKDTD